MGRGRPLSTIPPSACRRRHPNGILDDQAFRRTLPTIQTPSHELYESPLTRGALGAEREVSEPKKEGRSVGIDVGLTSFAVDSDGTAIENPRFFEQSKEKIKKLQRSLSRKKRFSKNWMKVKAKLEKVYDHITNQKRDFLHKLSRRYVDTYATVCVEDLNIKYLKEKGKSRGLRRSIHDASWGRFYSYLA
jgi:putative transposase